MNTDILGRDKVRYVKKSLIKRMKFLKRKPLIYIFKTFLKIANYINDFFFL